MDIRAAEISSMLKQQIKDFGEEAEVGNRPGAVGGGWNCTRVRPRQCSSRRMVEFPGGARGMALNLEADNVGMVIFGETETSRKATR